MTRFGRWWRRVLVFWFLGSASFAVQAHPHAWIYVGTTFLMSQEGYITAISQNWNYDNLLTEILLDELTQDGSGQALDLTEWAADTLQKLQPFGYFLQVKAAGKTVGLGDLVQYEGALEDEVLKLRFTVLLDPPVYAAQPIELAVFDPSFYIEILQHPELSAQVQGDSALTCELSLEYPEPSTEDFLRAAAIDSGMKVEPQFGALFAETVHLQCQEPSRLK